LRVRVPSALGPGAELARILICSGRETPGRSVKILANFATGILAGDPFVIPARWGMGACGRWGLHVSCYDRRGCERPYFVGA
ncbi:MAG: hypothetical protein SFV23_00390, partial [Planctomycetaceae bacterium]|nr:hypothetical protein [Planctomycetaceae bacterium]